MSKRVKPIRWIALLIALLVIAVAAVLAPRWLAVAAVQNACQRNWEITFGDEEKPAVVPAWLDELVLKAIDRICAKDPTPRRYIVYRERYRATFRGKITHLGIYSPEVLDLSIRSAMGRFPHLRSLEVEISVDLPPNDPGTHAFFEAAGGLANLETLEISLSLLRPELFDHLRPSESLKEIEIEARFADFDSPTSEICVSLSQIPSLERIEIYGCQLQELTGLDRLATLTTLKLTGNPLSQSALETLAQMAQLKELDLTKTPFAEREISALHSAIPNTTIHSDYGTYGFPQDDIPADASPAD